MSLEPTQDAWNGHIWEQDQSIANLLCDDLVQIHTEAAQYPFYPENADSDSHDQPADSALPMCTDEDVVSPTPDLIVDPKKAAGKAHSLLKPMKPLKPRKPKTTTNPKTKLSPGLQQLMEIEKEARYILTREELIRKNYLSDHKRDDREFWQLLERQRKRREDRDRRRAIQRDDLFIAPRDDVEFRPFVLPPMEPPLP